MHARAADVYASKDAVQVKSGILRPFEVVLALGGLVLFSPLIALSALAIAISSRGSVLFRQERVGRNGKSFVLYKLRTMRPCESGPKVTASDDDRVTRLGAFLRRAKLDELPELWNVVRGEMSLVGPRPEVPQYVDLQNPAWRVVLMARPGITDPMTLRLRNEELFLAHAKGDRERFYLEVLQPFKLQGYFEYLRKRNWWLDVKVLWKTGVAVVFPNKAPLPHLHDVLAGSAGSNVGKPTP